MFYIFNIHDSNWVIKKRWVWEAPPDVVGEGDTTSLTTIGIWAIRFTTFAARAGVGVGEEFAAVEGVAVVGEDFAAIERAITADESIYEIFIQLVPT
jgi:hypothetical protein